MECHEAGSDAVGGRAWKGLEGAVLGVPTPSFAARSGAEEAVGGTEAVDVWLCRKRHPQPRLGPTGLS